MQGFLKYVLSSKENFIPVKVSVAFIKMTQDVVLEILNLKDLNNLRDKFEGVAFFERLSNFLFGLAVLETHLGKSLINWKKVKQKEFISDLSMIDLDVSVITFRMGQLPIINTKNTSPIIFVLRRNDKNGWICGLADCEVLNNPANHKKGLFVGFDGEEKSYFIGFNLLRKFDNFGSLKKILEENEFQVR